MNDERWTIVDRLLGEALEREPHERAAFLREACGGDDVLRLDVESLITYASSGADVLSTPAGVSGILGGTVFVGRQIGSYTLQAPLGVGGMGEVYRARDGTLGRDVAIKILPRAFSSDPDRRARFDREARLLAALNHPHIGAIYGVEDSGAVRALVLELVEGDTLAERIAKGPILITEALTIARQIADALDAAHVKGITHRDLKPANIKITSEGIVKVLDFGLAKAVSGDASGPDLTESPILTVGGTRDGMILGTAAYMSPEQARGKAVDKRADIWAFGVVLYEMLTGTRPFKGDDLTETLASVVKDQSDLSKVPLQVHKLLGKCLEKDPRRRLRDIGDVWDLLDDAGPRGVATDATAAWSAPRLRLFTAAAIVVSAALAGLAAWQLKPDVPRQVIRFSHELPVGLDIRVPALPVVAISPDGRRVIYNTTNGVYLLSPEAFVPRLIPGTEQGLANVMFSPDGESIAYLSIGDNRLRKMPVSGGTPVELTRQPIEIQALQGASWGADNHILFTQRQKVMRVSADGGTPEVVFEVGPARGVPAFPELLPGGRSILFTLRKPEGNQIVVRSLDSGDSGWFVRGNRAHYLRTGHLVYSAQDSLFVQPFDLAALAATGSAVRVGDFVSSGRIPQYAVSDSGSLVFLTGPSTQRRTLAIASPEGVFDQIDVPPAPYSSPRVSRDGTQVVVHTTDGDGTPITASTAAIWVADVSGKADIRPLAQQGKNFHPIWGPDEKHVTFASDRDGPLSIYMQPADGSRPAERLTTAEEGTQHFPDSWSRDGKHLIYQVFSSTEKIDLWTLSRNAPNASKPFAAGNGRNHGAVFSRDGRWVAYGSTAEDPLEQIYVEPFPKKTGVTSKVTPNEGAFPVWSPDGNSLFFRRVPRGVEATGTHLVQRDRAAGALGWLKERELPIKGFLQFGGLRDYDVMPDGKGFVMVFPAPAEKGEAGRPLINVIVNWVEELKR